MKRTLFVLACVGFWSAQIFAETVAYWRFEAGPNRTSVLHPVADGTFYPSVKDLSGNGNDLSPWSQGGGAGFQYRSDVGVAGWPLLGLTNQFSIKNTGSWPAAFTDSATSHPTGIDIEAITPAQFTIEAIFKPETGGHRTIVGRDASGVAGDARLAALYFKINDVTNSAAIAFADVTGVWHEAASAANAIQGFNYPTDNDGLTGKWYYMAAVSDGATLTLYLANLTDGVPLQIVAQTDMTISGSADTSLAKGVNNGSDWHAGGWSVGRGLWNSGHVDRAWGFIDEVRISDTALDPAHFLLAPPVIAWNPSPYYGQEEVGTAAGQGNDVTVDLAWSTAMDAEDNQQVNGKVTAHYLYVVTDPADSNSFNADRATQIPADSPSAQVVLNMDRTWYWRVDESVNGSAPKDPNTIVGTVWMFHTLKSAPKFTLQPASVVAEAGQDVEFSVDVSSVSAVTYQWYKTPDNANDTPADDQAIGGNSPTLSLTQVGLNNESYYYCRATNAGAAVNSAVAALAIRREMAHWTLDQASYNGIDYIDELWNYPAQICAAGPDFVQGQKDGGVAVSPVDSWAYAGNWNPSAYSGQLTVSFWLNWAGVNGTWQTFISKRSGDWNNANVLWQICTNENGTTLWFQSPRATVEVASGLAGSERRWQHIVATYDGTTGIVYIDGQERARGGFAFGDGIDAAVCLGGNSLGSIETAREFTNGSLDEVRIFDYAVDEMGVARMFTADAPGRTACVQSLKPDARFDLNNDCTVGLADLAIFAANWMDCAIMPDCIQ